MITEGQTRASRSLILAAAGLFVCAGAIAVVVFMRRSLHSPDGGWDAWMIWNLRARWLLRSASLADAFPASLPVTHPDYPVLLPSLVALGWRMMGETAAVPIALAAFFALSYVALVVLTVASLRGTAWGLLAGAVILATPVFVWAAPAQYADIPLGTFVLAGAIALLSADRCEGTTRAGLNLLAGFALSLAALTKNEGLVYLTAFFGSVALVGDGPGRQRWVDPLWLLLGAAPGLIGLAWFKLSYAPPGEFLSSSHLWQRALDPARWLTVVIRLLRRVVYFQGWTLLLVAAALATVLVLRGPRQSAGVRRVGMAVALAIVLLAAAYLVTPQDITWHIDNSFDRLVLQSWGAIVMLLFLSMTPPLGTRPAVV